MGFFTASSQVYQLQATPVNYSHVQLSWNKPRNRSEYITAYLVTLRDPSAKTAMNFTVPSPTTSLMVEGLTGNTMYRFNVIAVSMFNGEQLYSNVTSTQVTTPSGSESNNHIDVIQWNLCIVDTLGSLLIIGVLIFIFLAGCIV